MDHIPNRQQLQQYSVNRPGYEAITQTLYDSLIYAAAGQNSLQFFALPQGQGVSAFTGVKTLSDTNMTLAGQLPAGLEFLVQSIELKFFPATPTVAAGMPGVFGAQLAATSVNDAYIFSRSGSLTFNILSKAYLQEAPLGRFPSKVQFSIDAAVADTTTAAAASQSRISFAEARGRPYLLKAPILLISNQNFNVTLAWQEGVQAITNPAKVVCVLDGIMYRKSQ